MSHSRHVDRSLRRPQVLFMIGQDRRGNWVVQEQCGLCGGLFVDRTAALRFMRSQNGYRPQAVMVVPGILELDLGCDERTLRRRSKIVRLQDERRTARQSDATAAPYRMKIRTA